MKKLLIGLLVLGSLSALAKSDMDRTCHFSVSDIDHKTIYGRVLAIKSTQMSNIKQDNGYRVYLNAFSKNKTMTVNYSDLASPAESETHRLVVKKSGVAKKVITDVNGDTVILRLLCAYEKN